MRCFWFEAYFVSFKLSLTEASKPGAAAVAQAFQEASEAASRAAREATKSRVAQLFSGHVKVCIIRSISHISLSIYTAP